MKYDWDEKKAEINSRKRGITFDEAQTVFDDPLFLVYPDPDHSIGENRYIIMGTSDRGELLVVSYTERGELVRLITARTATNAERRAYEQDDF